MAVHWVECPRDAMQGLAHYVPTALKVRYLNALLEVGFDTLDAGSFVSHKAVPQMADTAEVIEAIEWAASPTRLLVIVANRRGAEQAISFPSVRDLGFPFSISETFQQRNARQTIPEAEAELAAITEIAHGATKDVVVYLSMAFGNPYGDAWSEALVLDWAARMVERGHCTISLADTVGTAEPAAVQRIFAALTAAHPHVTFGAHFHARPDGWRAKVEAAWRGGCRRFDSAMGGYGGCPFAQDALVGNVATEAIAQFLSEQDALPALNRDALRRAQQIAREVFMP
jgi:hydroxymethylglutaryl-CoA lyase